MIMLDASVLIAFLDTDDAHHDRATALLSDAADEDLVIGSLTLAEVLVAPVRAGRLGVVEEVLDDLELEDRELPAGAARRLAALRVETGLRMPDCCVLLTAEDAGARLASFDGRLGDVARRRGVTVLM